MFSAERRNNNRLCNDDYFFFFYTFYNFCTYAVVIRNHRESSGRFKQFKLLITFEFVTFVVGHFLNFPLVSAWRKSRTISQDTPLGYKEITRQIQFCAFFLSFFNPIDTYLKCSPIRYTITNFDYFPGGL